MSEKALFEALGARASLLQQGGVGNLFFVDGYDPVAGPGSDTNDGSRERPFLTIKHALTRCVDWHHDVIVVLNHYQAAPDEDFPIVINKKNVHIIGAALPNLPWPAIHPPGATEVFMLTSAGQNSEIAFLTIGGDTAHGGISVGKQGAADGYYIHDCLFGHRWHGTPGHGIYQPADATHDAEEMRIERCKFLGSQGDYNGGIGGNGIDMLKDIDLFGPEIIDCVFMGLLVAINLVHSVGAVIKDNRIATPGANAGEGITLGANCAGCLIDGNHAMSQKATGIGATPYKDSAGAGVNGWGTNWGGEKVQLVA